MSGLLILAAASVFFIRIIRRDTAARQGISRGLWVPTIWFAVLASRPVSAWLGMGVGETENYSLEGSPADAAFYFVCIVWAFAILRRRGFDWAALVGRNRPLFAFYAYCLISVLWAQNSFVSFKRLLKEFGNLVVVLVVLTELNPGQAFRAVLARCGYVLIPLSLIFVRYFPEIGRRYNIHSGEMEAIGVTFQKNSLGIMIALCSVGIVWDLVDLWSLPRHLRSRFDTGLRLGVLAIGLWLLLISDSKTSLICQIVGTLIVAAPCLPILKRRLASLGFLTLSLLVTFYLLDSVFGIKEQALSELGRDATFTGRTDVWRELFALKTNPIIGTGFCSLWSDVNYISRLPEWVAFSAHNGYLEVYLDGGVIGVALLVIFILASIMARNRDMQYQNDFVLARFAFLLICVISCVSESNFFRMSAPGFAFLFAVVNEPTLVERAAARGIPEPSAEGIGLASSPVAGASSV